MGQRHLPPRQLHPQLQTKLHKIAQTTDNTYVIPPLRMTMRPVTIRPWPRVPIPSLRHVHTRAHPSPYPMGIPGMFAWRQPCRLLTHVSPLSSSCVTTRIITLILTYLLAIHTRPTMATVESGPCNLASLHTHCPCLPRLPPFLVTSRRNRQLRASPLCPASSTVRATWPSITCKVN